MPGRAEAVSALLVSHDEQDIRACIGHMSPAGRLDRLSMAEMGLHRQTRKLAQRLDDALDIVLHHLDIPGRFAIRFGSGMCVQV